MSFGSVPADMLAGAVEKVLAKINETELAASYERELSVMPRDLVAVFVEALFAAFRDRGEASEDAAEGAGATIEEIVAGNRAAVSALLAYARSSPDLVKEATAIFVEQRPDSVAMLPPVLRAALAEHLSVSS
jgi:hypothetical protein